MSYTPPPPPPGGNYPPGGGDNPPGGGYPPGGYPPGGYPPPPGYGGYSQPKTNQKALWSLILGILGLVCCGIFTGVPALILGNMAKKEIAASGGAETGDGMAKAGVILGIVSIVLSILGLILFASGVTMFPTLDSDLDTGDL